MVPGLSSDVACRVAINTHRIAINTYRVAHVILLIDTACVLQGKTM